MSSNLDDATAICSIGERDGILSPNSKTRKSVCRRGKIVSIFSRFDMQCAMSMSRSFAGFSSLGESM